MSKEFTISETNSDKGRGLYTKKKYKNGNVVLVLEGNYFPFATRTSIQVGDKHLESWEGAHVNHHCLPNTKVVIEQGEFNLMHYLVATRDIDSKEEITFDYNTTESIMTSPFKCECHGNWIKGKDYDDYAIDQMMNEGGMDYSGAFESDVEEEYDIGSAAPITKDDAERGSW